MKLSMILRGALAALALTSVTAVFANEVVERIKPVGEVCMAGDECAAAVVEVAAGPRSGKELYDTKCMACHAVGVAGAPKFGEWSARVDAKGMDGLFNSAWNGINAMPPKGTCADCSEDEIKGAIEYMVSQ